MPRKYFILTFTLPTNNKKNKMKKVLVLLVGSIVTLSAMSQTTPLKKVAEKDLRTDVKAIKDERAERNTSLAHGNFKAAKHDKKKLTKDASACTQTKNSWKTKV